jgi:hypothetical protein
MVVGDAVTGKQLVQLFHHINTGRFLLLTLESRKGKENI